MRDPDLQLAKQVVSLGASCIALPQERLRLFQSRAQDSDVLVTPGVQEVTYTHKG
jgi:hypothetical protein